MQSLVAKRRPAQNPFEPFLARQSVVLLDGGLATALETRGHDLSHPLWSARVLVDEPEEIAAVHETYLRAGADCIITSSYQATVQGFSRFGLSETESLEMLDRSVKLALDARDGTWPDGSPDNVRASPLVAASVGPYGAYLADGSEYTGHYDLDSVGLRAFHEQRFFRLTLSDADLLACETIPSLEEARVLMELLAESGRWGWLSFSCKDGGHLNDGTPIEDAVDSLSDTVGLAAIGVNCTPPRFVAALIERIRSRTELPIVVYPNSGEAYDATAKSWTEGPDDAGWADGPTQWFRAGAQIIGGCCRVGPETIRQLRCAFPRQ